MSKSNKANSEVMNSLHFMVAENLAKLYNEAEGNDEKLRVLREMRGFLKDNNITADQEFNISLKQLAEDAGVVIGELPFGEEDVN